MTLRPAPAPTPVAAAALLAALAAGAACDQGLEPEPICAPGLVGICGIARFTGTTPDSTEAVFLVAFPTYPQTCADLLALPPKFRPFPPVPLPGPYVDSVVYDVALAPDTYAWVVAVWKKQGPVTFQIADTALFRVAGDYRNPTDTTQRGVVTVPSGGVAGDVDLRVDLGNLHPVSDYVTCAAR